MSHFADAARKSALHYCHSGDPVHVRKGRMMARDRQSLAAEQQVMDRPRKPKPPAKGPLFW